MHTKRPKNNTYFGEVIDVGKAKRSSGLVLNPTAGPYEKGLYYSKVFMDPSNTATMRTRKSTLESGRQGSAVASAEGSSSSRFRLLQFNAACTNCDAIFRAITFLRDRLPEKAHLRDQNFRFNLSKASSAFKELASELGSIEPSLHGVTAIALFSVYERIVTERRNLDAWLKVATDATWRDTRLAKMALDLVQTEDLIRERERRQKAEKDGVKGRQMAEEEVTAQHTPSAVLDGRNRRVDVSKVTEDLNVEGDVAREYHATGNSLEAGMETFPATSTSVATPSFMQNDTLQREPSSDLTIIRRELRTDRSPNITQSATAHVTPSPRQCTSSASETTDYDGQSSPSSRSPSPIVRPTMRMKRARARDTDTIALLTKRVQDLEERDQQLTALIDHLVRLISNQRSWLEDERLPMMEDRINNKLMRLVDDQDGLIKRRVDLAATQMNTLAYQLATQQRNQLNDQGNQLAQPKTQVSLLSIDMEDIQRSSRKWANPMPSTDWEPSPMLTEMRTSFSSHSHYV